MVSNTMLKMDFFKTALVMVIFVTVTRYSVQATYYNYGIVNGNGCRTLRTRICPSNCRCMSLVQLERRLYNHDQQLNSTEMVSLDSTKLEHGCCLLRLKQGTMENAGWRVILYIFVYGWLLYWNDNFLF